MVLTSQGSQEDGSSHLWVAVKVCVWGGGGVLLLTFDHIQPMWRSVTMGCGSIFALGNLKLSALSLSNGDIPTHCKGKI